MGASAELVAKLYKNDEGQPFQLTEGQERIFNAIAKRQSHRWRIICPTRYGKTHTVAMALLTRCTTYGEKWAIVAPDTAKARIMMRYATTHALENPYTRTKLQLEPGETLERLNRERSKSRLTFKITDSGKIGELFILSAGGHRRQGVESALAGFGSPNVVLDESSLLEDPQFAMVHRMLGDNPDNFLCEIGNPFRRNHFYQAGFDANYEKILIDYKQAVNEGRYSQKFIDEARGKRFFDVLYACQFPGASAVDDKDYYALLTDEDLKRAVRDELPFGVPRLGVDVANGGEAESVWVIRWDNFARVLWKSREGDTMEVVSRTISLADEYGVVSKHIFVDAIGVGAGVADRLKEIFRKKGGVHVPRSVVAGEVSDESEQYRNRKAQNYWRLREWVRTVGALDPADNWDELLEIRYRESQNRRVEIQSKEDMRARGVLSPDTAEALMLTFDIPESATDFPRAIRSRVGISVPTKRG